MTLLRVASISRERAATEHGSSYFATILPANVQNQRSLMQFESLRV